MTHDTPQGQTQYDEEREAFEKWWQTLDNEVDGYTKHEVAWLFWQARAALASKEPTPHWTCIKCGHKSIGASPDDCGCTMEPAPLDELAQMSQDMGLYEPAPPRAGLDVDCKNCAHRGMIYGTSQDIYCEFCKHKAHTLKDYYKPKNTAPQSPTEPYHLTKEEHEIMHEALRGSSAPTGAAPLPDEVAEMVEKMRARHDADPVDTNEAADMLERLAQSAQHGVDTANQYIQESKQLLARIAELEKQHEGWQWVPKEPTRRMSAAGDAAYEIDVSCDYVWQEMLSAAPTPNFRSKGNDQDRPASGIM